MATAASDTNLADFVASRGLFKPASKWISILPPLDFVNLSSIIPDVCFRLLHGASSTTNMESVSVHQTVRVHSMQLQLDSVRYRLGVDAHEVHLILPSPVVPAVCRK